MSSRPVSFSSMAAVMAMVILAGCDSSKEVSPVPAGDVQVRLSGATIKGSPARSTLEVSYNFLSGAASGRKKYYLVVNRASGDPMYELDITRNYLGGSGTVSGQFVGPSLISGKSKATVRLEMADIDDQQRTCISNTITVSVR